MFTSPKKAISPFFLVDPKDLKTPVKSAPKFLTNVPTNADIKSPVPTKLFADNL